MEEIDNTLGENEKKQLKKNCEISVFFTGYVSGADSIFLDIGGAPGTVFRWRNGR